MGKHGGGALSGFSSSHHGHSSFGSSHHSQHHDHHHHHIAHSTMIIGNWGSYRRRPQCCFGGFCCIGFIVFIILIGVFSPRSQEKHLSLTQFESVLVNPSTKWTSQVDVYSTYGGNVTSYLLPQAPNSRIWAKPFYGNQSLSISPLQFQYYGYRLNREDKISASWYIGSRVYFYLIKGEGDLKKFKNGEIIPLKTLYGNSGTYTFTSADDDDYYLVWSNTIPYVSVFGNVNITVTYTKYDTTDYISRCTDPACYFHLASGTSQCVVIEAGQSKQANVDVFDVSYRTTGRNESYWIIFGPITGVFFVFVVAIIIVLACVARRKNSYSQISETTSFVPPPSNYGAPVIPPPTGYAPQAAPYAPYSPYSTAPSGYVPQPPGYMPPPVNSHHV